MDLILYCFLKGDTVKQDILNGGINCVVSMCCGVTRGHASRPQVASWLVCV